jgi:hypothetical protein
VAEKEEQGEMLALKSVKDDKQIAELVDRLATYKQKSVELKVQLEVVSTTLADTTKTVTANAIRISNVNQIETALTSALARLDEQTARSARLSVQASTLKAELTSTAKTHKSTLVNYDKQILSLRSDQSKNVGYKAKAEMVLSTNKDYLLALNTKDETLQMIKRELTSSKSTVTSLTHELKAKAKIAGSVDIAEHKFSLEKEHNAILEDANSKLKLRVKTLEIVLAGTEKKTPDQLTTADVRAMIPADTVLFSATDILESGYYNAQFALASAAKIGIVLSRLGIKKDAAKRGRKYSL